MVPDVQTLTLIGLALMAAGYLLLGALHLVASLRPITREAWPVLLSATLTGGLVLGAIWFGGAVLVVALLALVWRCGYEAAAVARIRFAAVSASPVAVGGALAGIAALASFLPLLAVSVIAIICMIAGLLCFRYKIVPDDPNVRFGLEIALFPGLPLTLFAAAGSQGGFGAWLLIAYVLVETFDSYALLGGKLFGRTKAFPVLSPRKTVEGLVLGAIMVMLTAAIAAAVLGLSIIGASAIALFVGVLAVTGDLAASALKRRSGVKDFPRVLRQQGGLLDITDAWIVAGAGLAALISLLGLI